MNREREILQRLVEYKAGWELDQIIQDAKALLAQPGEECSCEVAEAVRWLEHAGNATTDYRPSLDLVAWRACFEPGDGLRRFKGDGPSLPEAVHNLKAALNKEAPNPVEET